jgi:DNA-binding transcriptional LysR family regulator
MRNRHTIRVMDLRHLQSFDEAARRGSLSAAAQALGYTQSAVSRHIAALEHETGLALLQRRARGVRLTQAGNTLQQHTAAILAGVTAAREQMAAIRRLDAGQVRLGGVPTANVALLPAAMTELRRRAPGIELTISEDTTPGLLAGLHRGALDVAVVTDYHHQHLGQYDNIQIAPLLQDALLLALPPTHRLASQPTIRLAELAREIWVEDHPPAAQVLRTACARAGFTAIIGVHCGGWMGKQGFVAAGHGITLIPGLAATGARADLTIRALDPADTPARQVFTATAADREHQPAINALLHCLASATAQHQTHLAKLLARQQTDHPKLPDYEPGL